jgi:hypothetical protein
MSLAVVHKGMEMEIRKWPRLEKNHSKADLAFLHKRNESRIFKKAFGKEKRLDIIPCTEDTRIYLFYEMMTQAYHTRMLQVNCDTSSLRR